LFLDQLLTRGNSPPIAEITNISNRYPRNVIII